MCFYEIKFLKLIFRKWFETLFDLLNVKLIQLLPISSVFIILIKL